MKTLCLALCLVLQSCLYTACTVLPPVATSRHASVGDSGRADSGLIAVAPIPALPAHPTGYQIDASALARYNALTYLYAHEPLFVPPLTQDMGLTLAPDGTIWLDRAAMRRFALLSAWRRSGRIPVKPPLWQRLPYPFGKPGWPEHVL